MVMKQVFTIIPSSSTSFWFLTLIGIFLIAGLVLVGFTAYSLKNVKIEVSSAGLRIRGNLYGRILPLSGLQLDRARIIDLNQDQEHQPKWRKNGIGLPGYQSGWCKLKNGEKSLVFITKRNKVVYIPTYRGYSVMLSASQPDELIAALRKAG
jgi:hypothetical protein